jgi:hypothetical protein
MHKKFYLGNIKEGDHLEELGLDGMILKRSLNKCGVRAWTRFIWLRIRSSGRNL